MPVLDVASVSLVRESVRERGSASVGLRRGTRSASLRHRGERACAQSACARRSRGDCGRAIERAGVAGLEIVAADSGNGFQIRSALSSARLAARGVSVSASLESARLSDEVDVDIRLGEGTCIRARKFALPVEPRREIGILGRPTRPSASVAIRHGS